MIRLEQLKEAIATAPRTEAIDKLALEFMAPVADRTSPADWDKVLKEIRDYRYYDAYHTMGIPTSDPTDARTALP